jgi:hypothetical protein
MLLENFRKHSFFSRSSSTISSIERWTILGITVLLSGCPYHIWEPVGTEMAFPSFQISLDIPNGWHRYYDGTDDLLISYDGLTLQNIRIRDVSIEEKKAGEKTPASLNMAPRDLAEWVVTSSPGDVQLENPQVLESKPSTLAGNNGMRLLVSGQTPKGLRYNQLHYVYFQQKHLFVFSFTAVARHYFDRDEPVFEKIRMSFQGTKTSKG